MNHKHAGQSKKSTEMAKFSCFNLCCRNIHESSEMAMRNA